MYKVMSYRFDTSDAIVTHIEQSINMLQPGWKPILQSQSTDAHGNTVLIVTFKRISPEVDGF